MLKKGLIIVISAPSGAGKTTLCYRLVNKLRNLKYSISYTTRQARKGEKNGIDYFFVTNEKFEKMKNNNKFAEWACVHDHYYGTPHSFLKQTINSGNDIILDIDVQGGLKIKESYPEAILIFVMTKSINELEYRLRKRGKDSENVIKKRLFNARMELKYLSKYDYLVINDDLKRAVNEIKTIISVEHLRINSKFIPKFD